MRRDVDFAIANNYNLIVNGDGDLGFDGKLRGIIGQEVRPLGYRKDGLVKVEFEGVTFVVPPKNLKLPGGGDYVPE